MKFAEMEIINLKDDVITASACALDCPCFDATIPSTRDCPTDE